MGSVQWGRISAETNCSFVKIFIVLQKMQVLKINPTFHALYLSYFNTVLFFYVLVQQVIPNSC
jgi:hypothetical protein